MTNPLVMGIDPSLTHTGVVLLQGREWHGWTISPRSDLLKGDRLLHLHRGLRAILDRYRAELRSVAIEDYARGATHSREEMGEATGVVLLTIAAYALVPAMWPNTAWKMMLLGHGGLDKAGVRVRLRARGIEIPDEHQMEAYCIAAAQQMRHAGHVLPQTLKQRALALRRKPSR